MKESSKRDSGRTLQWVVRMLLVGLLATGVGMFPGQVAAAPPDLRLATWNMQAGPAQWATAYSLSTHFDMLALQEVPLGAPAGAVAQAPVSGGAGRMVEFYHWRRSARSPLRFLYIYRTGSRNLGIVTSRIVDTVRVVPGVYRPALAVGFRADNVMLASIHASANGGSDADSLVRRVEQQAAADAFGNWAALGDFNRNPRNLTIPTGAHIYRSGVPTQQSGGELDYMVSNVDTPLWQPHVVSYTRSDHWPVTFSETTECDRQKRAGSDVASAESCGGEGGGRPLTASDIEEPLTAEELDEIVPDMVRRAALEMAANDEGVEDDLAR